MPEQEKPSLPREDLTARLDERLESFPMLAQFRKALGAEWAGIAGEKVLESALTGLADGTLSLEEAVLGLTRRAAQSIGRVLGEQEQEAERRGSADAKYHDALLRARAKATGRARQPRKKEYLIRGKAAAAGPLEGWVVVAYAEREGGREVVGTGVAGAQGKYEISIPEEVAKELGEGAPKVVLAVGPDRGAPIHVTEKPVQPELGKVTTVNVTLPEGKREEAATIDAQMEHVDAARTRELERVMTANRVHDAQVRALGTAVKDELERCTAALEARLAEARARPPEPPSP